MANDENVTVSSKSYQATKRYRRRMKLRDQIVARGGTVVSSKVLVIGDLDGVRYVWLDDGSLWEALPID